MESVQATEAASAAVAKSPNTRVKLADIEAAIAAEYTFNLGDALRALDVPLPASGSSNVFTVCVLTMKNGFVVIGKAAPADPANFNAELGRKFAREDAIRQLWPLMGYSLRDVFYKYTLKNDPLS